MSSFIVVTGGVVSGIGKGITTASIGLLLKSSGFNLDAVKFDPYLNIDPGTMSPYEHGEVYVLEDGSETDLDLGHYERFLDTNLNKNSSVTAGKIYDAILSKEREGLYLGKNVQLIPHVTNYIQNCFEAEIPDDPNFIRLIEIGGSTGDMEAEIFLESFRQFKSRNKGKVIHIHLGYVPFLRCSNEFKSKPLQNSLRELLRAGLQPDILVVRYADENGFHVQPSLLDKIALFANLDQSRVIPLPDLNSIYEVPSKLLQTSIPQVLETHLKAKIEPKIPKFFQLITEYDKFQKTFKIVLVAKYSRLSDSYLSVLESLKIAATQLQVNVQIEIIDSEQLEENPKSELEWEKLKSADGIIVPGGFGNRGLEGKILAIEYARKNKIPFLGICLGLQMAVVEISRNLAGLKAFSSEMLKTENKTENVDLVVDLIPQQQKIHKKGGTMRLGKYTCQLEEGSLAKSLFKTEIIQERHRHRLEVQTKYLQKLEQVGLKVSGRHWFKDEASDQFLVEIVELETTQHPYFIATQSHPEFLSRPDKPHPLFLGLLTAINAQN